MTRYVPQARAFLDQQAKPIVLPPALGGGLVNADLPPCLDDALPPTPPSNHSRASASSSSIGNRLEQ